MRIAGRWSLGREYDESWAVAGTPEGRALVENVGAAVVKCMTMCEDR